LSAIALHSTIILAKKHKKKKKKKGTQRCPNLTPFYHFIKPSQIKPVIVKVYPSIKKKKGGRGRRRGGRGKGGIINFIHNITSKFPFSLILVGMTKEKKGGGRDGMFHTVILFITIVVSTRLDIKKGKEGGGEREGEPVSLISIKEETAWKKKIKRGGGGEKGKNTSTYFFFLPFRRGRERGGRKLLI